MRWEGPGPRAPACVPHEAQVLSERPPETSFDYVVVGAGSAGCVLASRLTEDRRNSVLLLEAGGTDSNINIRIPILVANILQDERFTWQLMTEPQNFLKGQTQRWVQGKVLGVNRRRGHSAAGIVSSALKTIKKGLLRWGYDRRRLGPHPDEDSVIHD